MTDVVITKNVNNNTEKDTYEKVFQIRSCGLNYEN